MAGMTAIAGWMPIASTISRGMDADSQQYQRQQGENGLCEPSSQASDSAPRDDDSVGRGDSGRGLGLAHRRELLAGTEILQGAGHPGVRDYLTVKPCP